MGAVPSAPAEEEVQAPQEEPVPQPETEPVPALPEEGPDEGDAPPADEGEPDVRGQLLDFIDELRGEDPELAEVAAQRLGVPTADERVAGLYTQQASQQVEADRQQRWAEHQKVSPALAQPVFKNAAKKFSAEAKAAAERFSQGLDPDLKLGDVEGLADQMAAYTVRSASSAYSIGQTEVEAMAFQELIHSPTNYYLNESDLQQLQQAYALPSAPERVAASMRIHLFAAARAQPDQQQALTKAQEAAQAKQLERAERLNRIIGGAGHKARGGAAPPVPQNDAALMADPKTPITKLEEILARRGAR